MVATSGAEASGSGEKLLQARLIECACCDEMRSFGRVCMGAGLSFALS